MSKLLNFGHIYDAKYDKFGEYFHRLYDYDNDEYSSDEYFALTWENDLYHNEIVEPYDFYKLIETKEFVIVTDISDENRLFLRLKYGHK